MNWFKVAAGDFEVNFISSNNYGDLKLQVNGQVYGYLRVSPFIVEQVDKYIKMQRNPKTNGGYHVARRELGKLLAYLRKNHSS
jgi:predicted GNAT family N-acyltransferase